jgi:hypothetical protein
MAENDDINQGRQLSSEEENSLNLRSKYLAEASKSMADYLNSLKEVQKKNASIAQAQRDSDKLKLKITHLQNKLDEEGTNLSAEDLALAKATIEQKKTLKKITDDTIKSSKKAIASAAFSLSCSIMSICIV